MLEFFVLLLFVVVSCTVVTGSLAVGSTMSAPLTIDFNDTTQSAQFDICTSSRKYPVSITAPVGELLRPHTLNEKEFITLQSEFVSFAAICQNMSLIFVLLLLAAFSR